MTNNATDDANEDNGQQGSLRDTIENYCSTTKLPIRTRTRTKTKTKTKTKTRNMRKRTVRQEGNGLGKLGERRGEYLREGK